MSCVTRFIVGLAKPEIPFEYFSMSTLSEFKGEREPMDGAAGQSYFCAACHGKSGEGKSQSHFGQIDGEVRTSSVVLKNMQGC